MKRRRLLPLAALTAVLLALPVVGQEGGDFDLSWSAVSTAGQGSASGPSALLDSVASPDLGDPIVGGTFVL